MKYLFTFLIPFTASALTCELPQQVDQPLRDLVAVTDHVRPKCNVRAILESNKALMPPSQEIIRLPNGKGSFINPYFTGRPSVPYPQEHGPMVLKEWRVERLAREPQRSTEDVRILFEKVRTLMLSQLNSSALSIEKKNLMMERMKKVGFIYDADNCSAPAWYTMATHTISFCPLAKTLPEYSLVTLISHELGHELDLCSLSSPFYKFTTPAPYPPGNESGFVVATSTDSPRDTAAVQAGLQSGKLVLSENGMPRSENPTLPVYECLAKSNPIYKPVAVTDHDSCGNTAHTETSAQTYGARSLSGYVRANPPSSKLEALAMMVGSMPTSFNNNLSADDKENDMNQIYFDSPSVQEALGCQPDPEAAKCMSGFVLGQ